MLSLTASYFKYILNPSHSITSIVYSIKLQVYRLNDKKQINNEKLLLKEFKIEQT